MGKPSKEQVAWMAKLGTLTGGGSNVLSGVSDPHVYADSGHANVQLHEEKDPPGVDLPKATEGDPTVTMTVKESGDKFELRRSNLLKEDRYVDKAAHKMRAKPSNLATLEVKTMEFSGPRGTFTVDVKDVRSDMPLPAMRFEMRGGIVYPIAKDGSVAFDKVNTPQIVAFTQWLLKEIEKRRKFRKKMAETVFWFQMSIPQLAAAVGGPEAPEGATPTELPPRAKTPEAPPKPPEVAPRPPETPPETTPTDIGNAPTEPAPPPPPKAKPNTPPPKANKGGETVDETPPPPPKPGEEPLTREEVLEIFEKTKHRSLPPGQKIRIKTPKGPEEMTVAEYRSRYAQAKQWMKQNPGKNWGTKFYDPSEAYQQAAEKFGLDPMWYREYGFNPYL